MNVHKPKQRKGADHRGGTGGIPSSREQNQVRGLSVRQFANAVGLGVTRCYIEIQLGRIHALKAGSRTIIPTTEIEAFFERLESVQPKNQEGFL